ncbi:metal ABC transporter substrate-binding protein [Halalkaliarchaeum sp. AArc-CO]|uniref:metal ABC transporter substrate-binding protein n=1 Tax=Halalkaliarchaeum sp. AArc-CO TaxID=2866381 RepID=UPI00217EA1DB|nr:metal ABC transporter substrate-binding protein [Halalkaliarchaeum sp. AArc-CO]
MKRTRRSVLKSGLGVATVGATAGCLGGVVDENVRGYASFFALWDWAQQVGGDRFPFENPVEIGRMGHGWSPDGDLVRDIAGTECFLYLDTPEFSWAQDVARELERDYDDVRVIDAMEGLEPYLIPFDAEPMPEPDYGQEYAPDDLLFEEFDIYDRRSNEQLGYWHVEHWHGGVPEVAVDATVPIGIVIEDEQGRVVPLGDDEPYRVDARLADGAAEDVVEIESRGDRVVFHGRSVGRTEVVFEIYHEGELVYDTDEEPAGVEVVESTAGGSEGASEFHDPHVWTDPVLAIRVVERIAAELGEIDPEHADEYAENASAYVERLREIDGKFEALMDDADRDVAVLAGHDSFQYLEQRYGFELQTPVGVTADAAESFDDVSRLIDTIEEHSIDTVLYDPFEAHDPDEELPQMVEVIFEHTDVEEALPLTPAEGTTSDWQDNGWGWVEQMEKINLPSLRAALGA